MKHMQLSWLLVIFHIAAFYTKLVICYPIITGELKKWHKITLTFDGFESYERPNIFQAADNPFSDYRLDAKFWHPHSRDKTFTIPGYFAADGNAAETSATGGNKWRVHFSPDRIGLWRYQISFRKGKNVAMSTDESAGDGISFNGFEGEFYVQNTDKSGRDFRGKGRLEYVGDHYLKFAESGEYFIQQGAGSPQNFLAYDDFDYTRNNKQYRKGWKAHEKDWMIGDPTWKNGKGKGIIGALNYLASRGMNSFSLKTVTLGGDDENVFPFLGLRYIDWILYDCSKLDQWEIVFEHADRIGLHLNFKIQDNINTPSFGTGASFDDARKLYYREMIARFSHHLALSWNLGEESDTKEPNVATFAFHFWQNDPYKHNIIVHNRNVDYELLQVNKFAMSASITTESDEFDDAYDVTRTWVERSAKDNNKLVVTIDKPGDAGFGISPDIDARNAHMNAMKNAIWGTIMAGGAGSDYYFGLMYDQNDLTCQDFRTRENWWDYARYALDFFHENDIPFWRMSSCYRYDDNSWCIKMDDSHYVLYLKNGSTARLDLNGIEGYFHVLWYDPRNGGNLLSGSVRAINGGNQINLGVAPHSKNEDWIVYVQRGIPTESPTGAPSFTPSTFPTKSPSEVPTNVPSMNPTTKPTSAPSYSPTMNPSESPSHDPTNEPTSQPTSEPTSRPTSFPTKRPTAFPTKRPTSFPTKRPTSFPTESLTLTPTREPTLAPTPRPSSAPTREPTLAPTREPTLAPTPLPTFNPTGSPSLTSEQTVEASAPTARPTRKRREPTMQRPTMKQPTMMQPTMKQPTMKPRRKPKRQPTKQTKPIISNAPPGCQDLKTRQICLRVGKKCCWDRRKKQCQRKCKKE